MAGEDKSKNIRNIRTYRSVRRQKKERIKFILSEENQSKSLTPTYLERVILPYLKSIENIQKIMNELDKNSRGIIKGDIFTLEDDKVKKNVDSEIDNTLFIHFRGLSDKKINFTKIISISQNSPITIELEGVDKVLNTLGDLILPSRKKLYEQERKVKILEQKQKIKEDKERLLHLEQKRKYNQEIELEKSYLELEEKKLELNEKKMNLILNFIKKTAPNLTETERIMHVMKLLPEFNTIISSPLELEILEKE